MGRALPLALLRVGSERRHCCLNRRRGKCVDAVVRVPGEKKVDVEGLLATSGIDWRATLEQ
jgi:hypothetical protein